MEYHKDAGLTVRTRKRRRAFRRTAEAFLEARAGIEPAHKGFADLSLTTWVPRPEPSDAREQGAQDQHRSRLGSKERAFGAGDRGRTGDIFLGKEALYH